MTPRIEALLLGWLLCVSACTAPQTGDAGGEASVDTPAADTSPDPGDVGADLTAPEVALTPDCTTDTDCDDGDPCTGLETCTAEGTCAPGEPLVCDDGDPCTFDGCLSTAGGCVSVPDATACDDGDLCTTDSCLATGCVNEATDCDDGDPCTDDACDTVSGECTHVEAQDGPAACDEPAVIGHLQITIRTDDDADAATDDAFELCLGDGLCLALDTPAYNEFEPGAVNEFLWPTDGLDASAITWVSIMAADTATDTWRPTCVSVVADGALLYCNDDLGIDGLGQSGGDDPGWTDLDKTTKSCTSCYPTVLSHGPIIGHTTATSARMWLRTAYSAEVSVRYGAQESLEGAVTLEPVTPSMVEDFVTVVELTELSPATTYFYEVTVDGTVARSGLSFQTAPEGPAAFDVAFGSCSKFSIDPAMPIFEDIAEADPDVLLLIGDNHYAGSTNYDTLRAFFMERHGVPSIAAVHAQTPTWTIWDDWDYAGNNTDGTVPGKETGLATFDRFWANPPMGSGDYPGVWHSFRWGDVEFFMLDDRYYRAVTAGTMLGQAQLDWLMWGLVTSTATFKVMATGVQWSQGSHADTWASFPEEWQLIVDHIMELGIDGVLVISGDVHHAEIRRITEASDSAYPLWEFTSSPLANTSGGCSNPDSEPDALIFCATGVNFGLMRFDTAADDPTVTLEVHALEGGVLTSQTLALSALSSPTE